MPSAAHSVTPRPGGGFNPGMGQFGEHLDEAAMQQAIGQKSLQQQKASFAKTPTPLTAQQKNQKAPARDMGSLTDELIKRPFEDLMDGFKSLADLNMWLGIEPSPEQDQERARKEVILKNYNRMTDEEQAIVKQKYQERTQRMQAEEEEKQKRQQLEAQQQHASIQVPTKAASGPVGPGMSGNQKAKAQLDWDRQRMNGPASAG